jgi:hypothetical protein
MIFFHVGMHDFQTSLHKSFNSLIDLLILILYFLIAIISYNKLGQFCGKILVLQPALENLDVVSIIGPIFVCFLCDECPL